MYTSIEELKMKSEQINQIATNELTGIFCTIVSEREFALDRTGVLYLL